MEARGARLVQGLSELSARHALGEVRGRGLLVALDLKHDIATKVTEIARDAGLIDRALAASLARMCGFRNILAHEGEHVDAAVVVDVLRHHLDDLARAGEVARNWVLTG